MGSAASKSLRRGRVKVGVEEVEEASLLSVTGWKIKADVNKSRTWPDDVVGAFPRFFSETLAPKPHEHLPKTTTSKHAHVKSSHAQIKSSHAHVKSSHAQIKSSNAQVKSSLPSSDRPHKFLLPPLMSPAMNKTGKGLTSILSGMCLAPAASSSSETPSPFPPSEPVAGHRSVDSFDSALGSDSSCQTLESSLGRPAYEDDKLPSIQFSFRPPMLVRKEDRSKPLWESCAEPRTGSSVSGHSVALCSGRRRISTPTSLLHPVSRLEDRPHTRLNTPTFTPTPGQRVSSRQSCNSLRPERSFNLTNSHQQPNYCKLPVHSSGLSHDQIGNVRKELYAEGMDPEVREGGVAFFVPVSEQGVQPAVDGTVVAKRLTKTKKTSLNYEERMFLANINRQVQLSKRREFAMRDIRNVQGAATSLEITEKDQRHKESRGGCGARKDGNRRRTAANLEARSRVPDARRGNHRPEVGVSDRKKTWKSEDDRISDGDMDLLDRMSFTDVDSDRGSARDRHEYKNFYVS